MTAETKIGVCNLCEAICGLQITVEGDRVTGIRGNPQDPLSRGHICPKGTALADIHADPDRLRTPLIKRNGEWTEATWDEALDAAADGLAAIIKEHGRDAVALYLGNPTVHSLGSLTHAPALIRAFRSRNVYSATSADQLPQQLIAHLMFGHQLLVPVPDIDRTDYFLVFGGNPMASNGSLMTVPDFPNRLRELKKRGGQMVVFDPRHTETARVATAHHFIRPGTDAWVLLAMLHTILAEGLDQIPSWSRGHEALKLAVAPFTAEYAESISGVPASVIEQIARDFAGAERAAAYGRVGVSTQGFGTICHWAVNCLNLVTGNLDREGGAMFTSPAVDIIGRGLSGKGHFDKWRSRVSDKPEFAGELPVAVLTEEMETPGEGQVRGLLTHAGNPVLSTPAGHRLARAIEKLDFRVAIDIYLNETTRLADVILPPTSALERDHYDLVFHVLAVRNTARFTPAVFDKPEGAMHDWEIYGALVDRLHQRLGRKGPLSKRVVGAARARVSPTATLTGLLATSRTGVTMRKLRKHPEGIDLGPLRSQLPQRLFTKDKRVDVAPDLLLVDLVRLRGTEAPAEDQLVLIGRRHKQDCNSWMHNTPRLTKGAPRHQLFMHPDDMGPRDIHEGDLVEISSRVGSVVTDVVASEDMMPGVVCLPHGYGHATNPQSVASTVAGASINDLTDPALTDISGVVAFNGVPVSVRPERTHS